MIVFTLTMPGRGSWNNAWSGEGQIYARMREERFVPQEIVGKSFYYRWDDGWCACVDMQKMPARETRRLKQKSIGFAGYDWMLDSLIKDGYIHTSKGI